MTTDAVGGVWTYTLHLARALRKLGIDVTIAGMGPPPSSMPPDLDVRWGDYKLEWQQDPWHDVDRAAEWLLSLCSPDLVHLNGYVHASLDWKCPRLVVAHSCVLSWWRAVHGDDAPCEWSEYRSRVSAGIHAADFLVAPSRAMLGAIDEHYGTPKQSSVIPNGVDPAEFRATEKAPFILTAGRLWDQAKNLRALDEIASGLDWRVYAAGDGDSAANIQLLGRLSPPDLREWLARASIYALPARYEPFGLSILEAALSSCALVLGDIASLRENWDGAATFVPPDDKAALARALQGLARDADLRREFQHEARARAARFTLDRMAGAYAELYAALGCCSQPATAFKS